MQLMMTKSQSGFNLVELGVVMGVIAIVSFGVAPGFQSMMGNAKIRSVAESFRNGLQLARTEAIKRNQAVHFRLNADNSWRVGCVLVNANCPAIISEKPAKEGSSANIVVSHVGGDTTQFTTFGTAAAVPGQLTQIDIDNNQLGVTEVKRLRIVVGVGGSTKMCEPAVTTVGDARKCP